MRKPLSATRKASFGFTVGSSLVDVPESGLGGLLPGQQFRMIGSMRFSYPFNKTWQARATYERGIDYVAQLTEPLFSDGFSAVLEGLLSPRTTFDLGGGYSTGGSALYSNTQPFDTYTGRRGFGTLCRGCGLRTSSISTTITISAGRPTLHQVWRPLWNATASVPESRSGRLSSESNAVLPGKQYTPQEILRILSDRKWIILIPFALGVMAAPIIASRVPELYRSETLIRVERQQIPESYVKVVTPPVVERLPAIREQILSRSRLERIIRDLDLYKDDRSTGVMEDVVGRMRNAVDVKLDSKESFRVSFESDNPRTAQAVAQRLASLSIEENLKERDRATEGTSQFLEAQLEDAKVRLLEKEKALEAYRQRHAGQLPSQLQSNLQSIQNAQLQLQAINESMNRARERRMLFERQLADAQIVVPVAATPGGPQAGTPALLTTAQQLDAARARREVYQGHYTADHPDMKALERSIRDLEAKLLEEGRTASEGTPARLLTPAEAARQKRVADLQAELDVIDHQLSASQVEATGLRRTINDLQSQVAVPSDARIGAR